MVVQPEPRIRLLPPDAERETRQQLIYDQLAKLRWPDLAVCLVWTLSCDGHGDEGKINPFATFLGADNQLLGHLPYEGTPSDFDWDTLWDLIYSLATDYYLPDDWKDEEGSRADLSVYAHPDPMLVSPKRIVLEYEARVVVYAEAVLTQG